MWHLALRARCSADENSSSSENENGDESEDDMLDMLKNRKKIARPGYKNYIKGLAKITQIGKGKKRKRR